LRKALPRAGSIFMHTQRRPQPDFRFSAYCCVGRSPRCLPRASVLGLTRCLGGGGRRVHCALRRRWSPTLESGWVQCNVLGARTTTHVLVSFLFRSCFVPSFFSRRLTAARRLTRLPWAPPRPSFVCNCLLCRPRQTVDAAHRLDSGGAPHRFSFSFKFMYCPNTPRANGPGRLPYTQPHSAFFFVFPKTKLQNLLFLLPSSLAPLTIVTLSPRCWVRCELMLLWCHCAASLLIGPSDASVRFGTRASPCLSTAAPLPNDADGHLRAAQGQVQSGKRRAGQAPVLMCFLPFLRGLRLPLFDAGGYARPRVV
jgi:hypothetical protein